MTMHNNELAEILHCLADERRILAYFKDRYCLDLLQDHLQHIAPNRQGASLAALRRGPFARLLNKPIVRRAMAWAGDGRLRPDQLLAQWPRQCLHYHLTLDRWGDGRNSWQQTTRPGCNLVLQLNFSNQHDKAYERAIQPDGRAPFAYHGHPIHRQGRNTMAWVRIDCDLAGDEALIEELQTDWLREILWLQSRLCQLKSTPDRCRGFLERHGIGGDMARIEAYLASLEVHCRLWQEAALTAAIRFIRDELGLRRIYMHSHATGQVMKRIQGSAPPRSLYSTLPRAFCFSAVDAPPAFIAANTAAKRRLRKVVQPSWFLLPTGGMGAPCDDN
jgi:hypothetical protein